MVNFSLRTLVVSRLSLIILASLLLSLFTIHYSLFTKEVHAQEDACNIEGDLSAEEAVNALNKCAIQKNIFDDKHCVPK